MLLQGRLLTADGDPPIPGWVRLDGDRIDEVDEGEPPATPDLGGPDALLSPGFIDAHVHLPQFESVGVDGYDLLPWLESVIFPAEATWRDQMVATRGCHVALERFVRAGTLGFAGYLTSHGHSLAAFATAHSSTPIRAIAGQVLMDRDGPAELIEEQPIDPRQFVRPRFKPSVNPRFAISCSMDQLRVAAAIARGGGDGSSLPIQTHLAETRAECERVRLLFPDAPHYTGVYDEAGLLTDRTLLAHCVHLCEDEWSLITQRGAAVVHCPTANTFLRSGLFDLGLARTHGVRLALGSDVAAGPDVAMPRVARAMIEVAKMRAMTLAPDAHIPTPPAAWHMITRGNADALGWRDAGRLEPGATADLLVLRPPFDPDEHVYGRLIYEWDDSYIVTRVVAGDVYSA